MPFQFKQLSIKDAYLIDPHIFIDERGIYKKVFYYESFKELGIPCDFKETSDIVSRKGALRGLHFQSKNSQAKLLHVVNGKLYDVIVDLRKDSPSYLKHIEINMDAYDNRVLFVPEGCAHGFMALEDNTVFSYQSTNMYDPISAGGIVWNDPDLNIEWPIKEGLIITDKDKNWPTLKEYIQRG